MPILGKIFLSFVLLVISIIYFFRFRKEIPHLKSSTYFFILFLLFCCLAGYFLYRFKPIFAYIFPVSLFIVLISLVSNLELAFLASLVFSVAYGLVALDSISLVVFQLLGSVATILVIYPKRQFRNFLFASLILILVNFTVLVGFDLNIRGLPKILGFGLAALISGLLFLIGGGLCLLIFSRFFKMTSFIELFEFLNPNFPLLKLLEERAPGTFYHSSVVADLAQAAAASIGADSLLAKIGGLYHDIGKIEKAEYFVENQAEDKKKIIPPLKRIKVIINHPQRGLELANEYKLPQELKDIISEHHGQGASIYFLGEVLKNQPTGLKLMDCRYKGPNPRTKVSAIVMLADSVEATVRSEKKFDEESIRKSVDKVINEKLYSGQLSDSSLTFKDLTKIKESFIKSLINIFHQRIPYPSKNAYGMRDQ